MYKRKFTKQVALEIFYRNDKSIQKLADEYNTTKNVVWFIFVLLKVAKLLKNH